jgi:hypothetical protein
MAPAARRRTVRSILSDTAAPHARREDVDTLMERLARIDAQRSTMSLVAEELHGANPSPALVAGLTTLERDLTLAARATSRLREAMV